MDCNMRRSPVTLVSTLHKAFDIIQLQTILTDYYTTRIQYTTHIQLHCISKSIFLILQNSWWIQKLRIWGRSEVFTGRKLSPICQPFQYLLGGITFSVVKRFIVSKIPLKINLCWYLVVSKVANSRVRADQSILIMFNQFDIDIRFLFFLSSNAFYNHFQCLMIWK